MEKTGELSTPWSSVLPTPIDAQVIQPSQGKKHITGANCSSACLSSQPTSANQKSESSPRAMGTEPTGLKLQAYPDAEQISVQSSKKTGGQEESNSYPRSDADPSHLPKTVSSTTTFDHIRDHTDGHCLKPQAISCALSVLFQSGVLPSRGKSTPTPAPMSIITQDLSPCLGRLHIMSPGRHTDPRCCSLRARKSTNCRLHRMPNNPGNRINDSANNETMSLKTIVKPVLRPGVVTLLTYEETVESSTKSNLNSVSSNDVLSSGNLQNGNRRTKSKHNNVPNPAELQKEMSCTDSGFEEKLKDILNFATENDLVPDCNEETDLDEPSPESLNAAVQMLIKPLEQSVGKRDEIRESDESSVNQTELRWLNKCIENKKPQLSKFSHSTEEQSSENNKNGKHIPTELKESDKCGNFTFTMHSSDRMFLLAEGHSEPITSNYPLKSVDQTVDIENSSFQSASEHKFYDILSFAKGFVNKGYSLRPEESNADEFECSTNENIIPLVTEPSLIHCIDKTRNPFTTEIESLFAEHHVIQGDVKQRNDCIPGVNSKQNSEGELSNESVVVVTSSRRKCKLNDDELIFRIGCIFQEFSLTDDLTAKCKRSQKETETIFGAMEQTEVEMLDIIRDLELVQIATHLYRITPGYLTFDIPVF